MFSPPAGGLTECSSGCTVRFCWSCDLPLMFMEDLQSSCCRFLSQAHDGALEVSSWCFFLSSLSWLSISVHQSVSLLLHFTVAALGSYQARRACVSEEVEHKGCQTSCWYIIEEEASGLCEGLPSVSSDCIVSSESCQRGACFTCPRRQKTACDSRMWGPALRGSGTLSHVWVRLCFSLRPGSVSPFCPFENVSF